MLWSFELIPALPTQDSPLDSHLPPVEVDEFECNCSNSTSYCLVATNSDTSTELLSDHSEEGSTVISKDEWLPEDEEQEDNSSDQDDHQSDPDEVEYFSESFNVKGSFWATKYQDALKEALELKSTKENVMTWKLGYQVTPKYDSPLPSEKKWQLSYC